MRLEIMAKTIPGTLIVQPYNPAQTRRKWLLVIVLWLASLVALFWYCKSTMTPGFARTQTELAGARAEIVRQVNVLEAAKAESARFQRGEQVAKEANVVLQKSVEEREAEITNLRADLNFYQRFAGGGNAEALGVQDIAIRATDDPRVFNYALAVSQNLKRGKLVSGKLRFSISGIQNGKPKRLDLASLLGDSGADALKYEFKYFQRFNGTLYLPEGFAPGAIKAKMVNDDGESAEKELTWKAALSAASEGS
jgi:hypothetical protein